MTNVSSRGTSLPITQDTCQISPEIDLRYFPGFAPFFAKIETGESA